MNQTENNILTQYIQSRDPQNGKRMSRRQLLTLASQLAKKYKKESVVLKWILCLDKLPTPVAQRAACKWLCMGTVILPEDAEKVLQAVKVAKINHVDPLQYSNPMEIVNGFARLKKSGGPIDPATVSTLKFRFHNPEWDLDVYDVEESDQSRRNLRQIINTHLGVNCNPWCLLYADKEGNLQPRSKGYWDYYHGFSKRVAFQHGRLYAFSAGRSGGRIWWDRQDIPHEGARMEDLPVENDALKRRALFRVDPFTGEKEMMGRIWRGSKQTGLCEHYRSLRNRNPYLKEYYWNGRRLRDCWKGMTEADEKELFENSDINNGIIRVPESFTVIPDGALRCSRGLTEIYIPDSVQSIGNHVFDGCLNLKKVRLPARLSRISEGLFQDCTSLRSVHIPASVREIARQAFSGCSALKEIKLPRRLSLIGDSAFSGCREIREVDFPGEIETIGNGAFGGCQGLTAVSVPSSVTQLPVSAFCMCPRIRTITVAPRWYGRFVERYGRGRVVAA